MIYMKLRSMLGKELNFIHQCLGNSTMVLSWKVVFSSLLPTILRVHRFDSKTQPYHSFWFWENLPWGNSFRWKFAQVLPQLSRISYMFEKLQIFYFQFESKWNNRFSMFHWDFWNTVIFYQWRHSFLAISSANLFLIFWLKVNEYLHWAVTLKACSSVAISISPRF